MSDDKSNDKTDRPKSKDRFRSVLAGTDIEVSVTPEFMEAYFGPRCLHYDAKCIVCSNYRRFDKYGWVYITVNRDKFLELAIKGELK